MLVRRVRRSMQARSEGEGILPVVQRSNPPARWRRSAHARLYQKPERPSGEAAGVQKSRVRTALAFVAGAALLGALLWYVGPASVLATVQSASPLHLLLAATAYGLFFLLRGIRWKMLFSTSAPDVRLSTTTGTTAVGWLANSILPLKGGEVLRAALLARRDRVSLVTSAATVALERVLDLLGLAIVAAVALLLLPEAAELPAWMVTMLEIVWVLPLVCLLALAALVRWRAGTLALAARATRPLGKFGAKLQQLLDLVLSGFAALAQRPRLLARLVPLTVAVALVQALVFTFLVMAFLPGTGAMLAFSGSAIFLLSFIVSVTPGNVGTYEAAFVAVFVALGTPSELAVPAAVLTHLATTGIVALAGGIALLALGLDATKNAWRPTRVQPAPEGGVP